MPKPTLRGCLLAATAAAAVMAAQTDIVRADDAPAEIAQAATGET